MKKILSVLVALIVLCSLAFATEVNVDIDIDSGEIDIAVDDELNTDSETRAHFYGVGGFEGNLNSDDADGELSTLIGVATKGTTARSRFEFDSSHNLGSQNSNDNKMVLSSWVEGEVATMDMYLHNSPFQSQAERVSGQPMVSSSDSTLYLMGYSMANSKRDDSNTNAYTEVTLMGIGAGRLGKTQYGSNHLARGIGYNSNALDVRDGEVSAEGEGIFEQYGYGENSLKMNGFVLGSGECLFTATFSDSLYGTYSYYGK